MEMKLRNSPHPDPLISSLDNNWTCFVALLASVRLALALGEFAACAPTGAILMLHQAPTLALACTALWPTAVAPVQLMD